MKNDQKRPPADASLAATPSGTSGLTLSTENEQLVSNSELIAISESVITINLKKLMGDGYLKKPDINVNTTNGVATLKGSAPDNKASRATDGFGSAHYCARTTITHPH